MGRLKLWILELSISIFNFMVNLLLKEITGGKIKAIIAERIVPLISRTTQHGPIKFYCPSSLAVWRAETLLTKEPETLEWLDSIADGEVLWDIGANVGTYSLYAARRNLRVMAFEPSAFNYFILCKNIEINRLSDKITAYCLAFSDTSQVGYLNMTNTDLGGALSEFGREDKERIQFGEMSSDVVFRHGMISRSIDDFISENRFQFPNHIKIDVDGLENQIIMGARETIKKKTLKTILIEMDEEQKDYVANVTAILEESGFVLSRKRHSEAVESSAFSSTYNFIFSRRIQPQA